MAKKSKKQVQATAQAKKTRAQATKSIRSNASYGDVMTELWQRLSTTIDAFKEESKNCTNAVPLSLLLEAIDSVADAASDRVTEKIDEYAEFPEVIARDGTRVFPYHHYWAKKKDNEDSKDPDDVIIAVPQTDGTVEILSSDMTEEMEDMIFLSLIEKPAP